MIGPLSIIVNNINVKSVCLLRIHVKTTKSIIMIPCTNIFEGITSSNIVYFLINASDTVVSLAFIKKPHRKP